MLLLPLLLIPAQEIAPEPVEEVKTPTPEEKLLYTVPADYPDDRLSSFVAPGGERFVVHISGDDGTTVILDGEAVGRHAFVNGPAWGEKTVAWTWGDPDGRRSESWTLWQDGKDSRDAEWMGPVEMDGKTPVYWAGDGVKLDGDGVYSGGDYKVYRGKKGAKEEYKEAGMFGAPLVLPKGKTAYVGRAAKGYQVVFGKKEFGNYLWVSGMVVSADGGRAAWAGFGSQALAEKKDPLAGLGKGGGFGLSLIFTYGSKADGKKKPAGHGGAYRSLAAPALGGPKGAHLGYLARRPEGGILVVKDDVELPGSWGAVGTPVFSPDGSQLAFTVNQGAASAGMGPGSINPGEMDGFDFGPMPEFGRDLFGGGASRGAGGRAVPPDSEEDQEPDAEEEEAMTASSGGGECHLVVDGEIQTEGFKMAIRPVWSPLGTRVVCRVQTAEGQAVAGRGFVGPSYDQIGSPLFLDEDRIAFGARRGREVLWVVLEISD